MLDLGAAAPATGAEPGLQGAFSRLLSALGAATHGQQGKEPVSGAPGTPSEGEGKALAATALPDIAGTGKILPADAEALPEAAENAAAAEAALAALALTPPQVVQPVAGEPAAKAAQAPAPAPALPLPLPQRPAGLPLPVQAEGEAAKPATPAVAIQVAPLPASGEATAATPRDSALAAEKPAADFAAKLQPAGASAGRGRDPAAGDRPAAEPAVKAPGRIAAEPASIQAPAPVQPTVVAAATSAAAASDAAPSFTADKPVMETGIARELSRIVDSLASAREAMTAKGATLALDHAEFGELSLRFDQRRDGQLGVQIAAADPDAHRAVAAAVAADRSAFAQGDGSAPGGQQNAHSGGNASARGGSLGDRDGGAAEGNTPHRERQEGRRPADTDNPGQGTRRGDDAAIYA
ncbi:hypothetical protein [Altererythrobacter sp. C41]|uniref:hypothetical protein n=1 Tax=Altererythrobacter sp. C41 TaxID=2806021 RepID=UPI001933B638|nr:hypothetical protein [Altererythrobacter sp. C41]MBM0170913.1 hypothetical protein [Altererythrobacter sp. C41]